ncbi:hypothetical protein C8Q70DRAFT_979329 [Cubamyces menziesii]|nr:hypothetical protein C8Q70DRAFT_979329 [Cubamyces menziesii]
MNAWDFPVDIPAYTSARVYVEFDEGVGKHPGDDAGDAHYEIIHRDEDPFKQFQFAVKFRDLLVRFPDFPVESPPGKIVPRGSEIGLGWRHDNSIVFVLTGEIGKLRLIKYQRNHQARTGLGVEVAGISSGHGEGRESCACSSHFMRMMFRENLGLW